MTGKFFLKCIVGGLTFGALVAIGYVVVFLMILLGFTDYYLLRTQIAAQADLPAPAYRCDLICNKPRDTMGQVEMEILRACVLRKACDEIKPLPRIGR